MYYNHMGDQPRVMAELQHVYNKYDMYPHDIFDNNKLVQLNYVIEAAQKYAFNQLVSARDNTNCSVIKDCSYRFI